MQPVKITGITIESSGNGRKLGYPTANIHAETDLRDGVYFGFADLADYKHRPALIFVGIPTTVGDEDRRVEAYLIDIPDKDYYGQTLNVEAVHFYRNNQTFENLGLLQEAIHQDEVAAQAWFNKN